MTKIKLVKIFSERRNHIFVKNNLCCRSIAIKCRYVISYEFMTYLPIIIRWTKKIINIRNI